MLCIIQMNFALDAWGQCQSNETATKWQPQILRPALTIVRITRSRVILIFVSYSLVMTSTRQTKHIINSP